MKLGHAEIRPFAHAAAYSPSGGMTKGRLEMDRVERMRHAAEGDDVLLLRDLVQALLDDGVSEDTLYEDLSATRRLLSESDEDKVLDVMDLLVGWGCEKLVPRPPKP